MDEVPVVPQYLIERIGRWAGKIAGEKATMMTLSIREHPLESQPRPAFHSSHTSARRGVVLASYRVEKPIPLRSVPSSHENDQLSWPDRQTVRRAGDDTELEHHNCDRADFERPGEERPLITRHQN